MQLVYIIAMIVALIGMVVCQKKQNNFAAAKPLALILMLVVAVCGVMVLSSMFGDPHQDIRNNENYFYSTQTYMAGKTIKDRGITGKVVMLLDENYKQDPRTEQVIEMMKKGLGHDNVVFDTVVLPDAETAMDPLYMRMRSKDFDAVIDKYADAAIVVTYVALPLDFLKNSKYKNAKTPKFAFVNIAESPLLRKLLPSGQVEFVVTISNKAVFNEDPAPADPEQAFNIRYAIVDKNNYAEYKDSIGIGF